MNVKTLFQSFLRAFSLLLYLSGQLCASGEDAEKTEKPQHEYSRERAQVFEALENSVILDVPEQTATTGATVRGAASDITAELQRISFPVFAFDADAETRIESSNHCENSHLCSLNNDHQPYRCSCHSQCHLFDDCCEDAVQSDNSKIVGPLPRTAYSCYLCNSPIVKAVNIITSCPERYEIEAVVKACNQSLLSRDYNANLDSLSTPVTDGSTGLTYGNVYCAICWDANAHTSEPWLWNFYCNNNNYGRKNTTTTPLFLSSRKLNISDESGISMLAYLRKMCKSSFVPPRKFSAPFTECDPTEISTCPPTFDSTDELVNRCLSAPVRRVYYNNVAYRNVYCLACNHNEDHNYAWSCLPPLDSTSPRWNFAILVSPSTESCDPNEPLRHSTDKADDLCSRLARCIARDRHSIKCTGVCPSEIRNKEGKCRTLNITSLCSFDEVFDESSIACDYWSLFSNDTVIVQLNSTVAMCYSCVFKAFENYTIVNGSLVVAVNGTRRFYNNMLSYVKEGLLLAYVSEPAVTTLSPMENDGTGCYSSTLHWGVPLTTLLLSQCCMIVYVALYTASQRLRCFLGEIVLNQTIGLFMGFTFFTLRWITDNSLSVCRPLVILLHYFYTAAFAWTSLFAIEVARAMSPSVILVRPIRLNRKHIAYYMVGWGSPLIPVLLGVAADELVLEIRPEYGAWLCFFGGRLGFTVLFAAPMGVWLTIDVAVYVYVIVRLAVVERQTRMARDTQLEKLLLSVKLLLALCLPWAFAIAASFTDVDWVRCAFKVATSLQGTFILFIFGMKRDVMASLKCCKPRQVNQATARSSSTSSDIAMLATPELPAQVPVLCAS